MNRACVLALAILVCAGCKREQTGGTKPRLGNPDEYRDFFVGWLKAHGEKDVVSLSEGVSVAGSPVRFSARTYGVDHEGKSSTVEIEFTTLLPDKRTVVDYVAGWDEDIKSAKADAIANFTLTTLHVLCSALINDKDPHLRPQMHNVGGKPRAFYIGGWGIRTQSPIERAALERLSRHVVDCIIGAGLDDQMHWVKVVYGQNKGKLIVSEATFDNFLDKRMTAAVNKGPWPKKDDFYMLKLFVLVK
jgi:hypothetical protein